MKLPTGGGNSQNIIGRVNIDTSSAQRSLEAMAQAAQASAKRTADAFKVTEVARKQQERAARAQASADRELQRMSAKRFADERRDLEANAKLIDKQVRALERQKKAYAGLGKSIEQAQWTLAAFAAAGGLVAFTGLRAADSIDILTKRYTELAGSVAEGNRMMERVASVAKTMNAPIREAQRNFLGLIPAVRDAGGSIEQYANLALRLQTLNPAQGLEGSIFAIREALSTGGTDLVSLSERFNLPRKILRDAIKETGNFGDALDLVLDRYGATTEAAVANSRSLAVLTAQIRDTAERALEKTFAGALEVVRNALEGANRLLESMPQWLIDIGAFAVVGSGALAGLALAGNTVVSSFTRGLAVLEKFGSILSNVVARNANKAADAVENAAKSTNKFDASKWAVRGLAVAGGVGLGIEATRALGRATGNEQLANSDMDDLLGYIKKFVYIAIGYVLEFVERLAIAGSHVATVFQTFEKQLQRVGLRFQILVSEMALGIQRALGTFGDQNEIKRLEALLNGTGIRAGGNFADDQSAGRMQTGLYGDLIKLENEVRSLAAENENAVISTFDTLQKSLYDAFFPAEEQIEEIGDSFNTILTTVSLGLATIAEQQGTKFAEGVDEQVSLWQELNELMEDGTSEGLEDRLRGLERERDAIQSVIPELTIAAESSEEAAAKLAEYNTRLDEITTTLPQFMDALEAITFREVEAAYKTYLGEVDKANADHAKALQKIGDDQLEAEEDLAEEGAEKLEDINDKIAEAEAAYQEARLKAEETFFQRMADIQRNYFRAVTLAASMLDAAGVAAAIQERNDQRREANEQLQESLRNADAQRQERLREAEIERQDLIAFLAARRQEILNDFAARRADAEAQRQSMIQVAYDAYAAEHAALKAYYDQRLQDLIAYQEAERALRQQAQITFLQDLAKATLGNLFQQAGATPLGQSNLGNVSGALASVGANLFGNMAAAGSGAANTIGQVLFNIYDATDPEKVAAAVNTHLVALAES